MSNRRIGAVALDVGRKRIGVAVCDPAGEVATALTVVQRRGTRKDIRVIINELGKRRFDAWVVGLPTASEQDSSMHNTARRFAQTLAATDDRPVWLVDEAMTSAQAHDELRMLGLRQARRQQVVDKVAAKLILDRWLAGATAEMVVTADLAAVHKTTAHEASTDDAMDDSQ